MKKAMLAFAFLSVLGLAACDKPTVVPYLFRFPCLARRVRQVPRAVRVPPAPPAKPVALATPVRPATLARLASPAMAPR